MRTYHYVLQNFQNCTRLCLQKLFMFTSELLPARWEISCPPWCSLFQVILIRFFSLSGHIQDLRTFQPCHARGPYRVLGYFGNVWSQSKRAVQNAKDPGSDTRCPGAPDFNDLRSNALTIHSRGSRYCRGSTSCKLLSMFLFSGEEFTWISCLCLVHSGEVLRGSIVR